jgi:acyl-CoA thioesterase FadM
MAVLIFRLPLTAARAARRAALPLDGTSVLRMRVRPTDLDWYGHMNNGRYLTNMDLGRTDLAGRAGLLRAFRRERIQPVMAGATIRFRRPLEAFQRYELHSRIMGWDDRWTFFEQRFLRSDGKLAALAFAKVAVRGADGLVSPADVAALVGWQEPSPELPAEVEAWQRLGAS